MPAESQAAKDDDIRARLSNGEKWDKIASEVGVSRTRISRIAQGQVVVHRRGRPCKVTEEVAQFMDEKWMSDAQLPDEGMAQLVQDTFGVGISRQTAQRHREKLHFRYRPAFKVQELKPAHVQARLHWVTRVLNVLALLGALGDVRGDEATADADWGQGRWRVMAHILFSDESRFCRGPDSVWVRVKRGQWNETAVVEKAKFPAGVMVFGVIGPGFKSDLVRLEGNIGAAEYQDTLRHMDIRGKADQLYGQGNWCFMQDGAPAHTAESTMGFLRREMPIVPGWPANSCDLNPIEMMWAIVAGVMGRQKVKPETPDQIWEVVRGAWNSVTQDTIDRLVADFPRRCLMVREVQGASISQLLSSHMAPRAQDIPEEPTPELLAGLDAETIVRELQASRRGGSIQWKATATRLSSEERIVTVQALKEVWRWVCQVEGNAELAELVETFDRECDEDEPIVVYRELEDDEDPPVVPAKTAFLQFARERGPERKAAFPEESHTEFARALSGQWKALAADERLQYAAQVATSDLASPRKPRKGRKKRGSRWTSGN